MKIRGSVVSFIFPHPPEDEKKKQLKFRYKGVGDGAAAPLELCHHSRAHETDQGRFQGHLQVMADRRRRSELLSSRRRVDKVTAPRRPAERARHVQSSRRCR